MRGNARHLDAPLRARPGITTATEARSPITTGSPRRAELLARNEEITRKILTLLLANVEVARRRQVGNVQQVRATTSP